MIIPLLIKIICNEACAEHSVISPAEDPICMQDSVVYKREAIIKRSNIDEQTSKKFDENISLKATPDDLEQKKTKSLALKLANETLKSPQMQRNIKKLANLSESRYNRSKTIKDSLVNQKEMESVFESAGKLSKSNHKGKRKKTRSKRRHGIKQRKEHLWLDKQNYIKVGKIILRDLLFLTIFLL